MQAMIMAEIPSGLGASAAQAGSTSRDVASSRDADAANRTDAGNRRTKAIEQAGSAVDTEDGDTQVFSESEGTGSQGRALEGDETPDQPDDQAPGEPPGLTRDNDGHVHLDLEA